MSKKAAAKKPEEEEDDSGSDIDLDEVDEEQGEEDEVVANDLKRDIVVWKVRARISQRALALEAKQHA